MDTRLSAETHWILNWRSYTQKSVYVWGQVSQLIELSVTALRGFEFGCHQHSLASGSCGVCNKIDNLLWTRKEFTSFWNICYIIIIAKVKQFCWSNMKLYIEEANKRKFPISWKCNIMVSYTCITKILLVEHRKYMQTSSCTRTWLISMYQVCLNTKTNIL